MNSFNWSVPNIWIFIAQLVEHCSANIIALEIIITNTLGLYINKFNFPSAIFCGGTGYMQFMCSTYHFDRLN